MKLLPLAAVYDWIKDLVLIPEKESEVLHRPEYMQISVHKWAQLYHLGTHTQLVVLYKDLHCEGTA